MYIYIYIHGCAPAAPPPPRYPVMYSYASISNGRHGVFSPPPLWNRISLLRFCPVENRISLCFCGIPSSNGCHGAFSPPPPCGTGYPSCGFVVFQLCVRAGGEGEPPPPPPPPPPRWFSLLPHTHTHTHTHTPCLCECMAILSPNPPPVGSRPHIILYFCLGLEPLNYTNNLTKYCLEPLYYEFYIRTLLRAPRYVNNVTKYCLEPFPYEFYIAGTPLAFTTSPYIRTLLRTPRYVNNVTKYCLEPFSYEFCIAGTPLVGVL